MVTFLRTGVLLGWRQQLNPLMNRFAISHRTLPVDLLWKRVADMHVPGFVEQCISKRFYSRYADPKNDVAFKRVFADTKNQACLTDFLNSALELTGDQKITKITLKDTAQQTVDDSLKGCILDVFAEDELGHQYIIEMQVVRQSAFSQRMVYYASRVYGNQLVKGENYSKLKGVYLVAVMDFELPDRPDHTSYLGHYKFFDARGKHSLTNGIELVFIELPKFKKNDSQDSPIDRWALLLKEAEGWKTPPEELLQDPAIASALETLEMQLWTKDEKLAYERYLDRQRSYIGQVQAHFEEGVKKGTEIGKVRGKVEGIEIGKVEGIEIGKVEGIEIGKVEGIEIGKVEIALQLIDEKMDLSKIEKVTGIAVSRLKQLKRQLKDKSEE